VLVRELLGLAGCLQRRCGLSVQHVSVVGVPSPEYPHEVGKYPIAGTLAPPVLMQAFAPFGPIAPFLATPLECATLRRSRTLADLQCKGGRICASFRECHGAVGVCGVTNDEDM